MCYSYSLSLKKTYVKSAVRQNEPHVAHMKEEYCEVFLKGMMLKLALTFCKGHIIIISQVFSVTFDWNTCNYCWKDKVFFSPVPINDGDFQKLKPTRTWLKGYFNHQMNANSSRLLYFENQQVKLSICRMRTKLFPWEEFYQMLFCVSCVCLSICVCIITLKPSLQYITSYLKNRTWLLLWIKANHIRPQWP